MNPLLTGHAPAGANWRASKALIITELAIVACMFVADTMKFIPFSKTPFLLVLAVASFWLRGVKWRDVGFRLYRNWPLTIALGVLAGAVMEAIELYVSQPFLVRLLRQQPDLSLFQALHRNLKLLAILIALAWTLAAFCEEIVYRGYLMNESPIC
jgi:membrane protease YdiL (CAAX protease family)